MGIIEQPLARCHGAPSEASLFPVFHAAALPAQDTGNKGVSTAGEPPVSKARGTSAIAHTRSSRTQGVVTYYDSEWSTLFSQDFKAPFIVACQDLKGDLTCAPDTLAVLQEEIEPFKFAVLVLGKEHGL